MSPPSEIELANAILACRSFDEIASTLLPPLTLAFDARSSCAFEMRREAAQLRLGRATHIRMPAGSIADYGMRFVNLDPVCAPAFGGVDPRAVPPDGHCVVRLSDRCTERSLHGSEYYNEFLRDADIRYVLGLMVRPQGDPSRVIVLGFHRPRDARDFGPEVRRAMTLVPALRACAERLALSRRVEDLEARHARSQRRTVRLVFGAGAMLLQSLEDRGARVPLCLPAAYEALLDASPAPFRANARWQGVLSDLSIRGIGADWQIRVKPETAGPGERSFSLQFEPPRRRDADDAWLQATGLTDREAEVVGQVARGLRNAEIARQLDLSVRTVENHLRSIYGKAGVRSRTQLLAAMARED